jgi:hypothetical protein
MANGDDEHDEPPAFREKYISRGGKVVKQTFDLDDWLFEEAICDVQGRAVEVSRFDKDGKIYEIVVYEFADDKDWRAKKITSFDADLDLITSQERGSPPIIGELYSGEKPFHIYPKKEKPNTALEPTPTSVTPPADAGVAPAAVVAHL